MKTIDVGSIFSLRAPDNATWTWNGGKGVLCVRCEAPSFFVTIHSIHTVVDDDRMKACLQHLEVHVREVIGPPFETSVQEVLGETWAGYQAVTAMGGEQFKVNRCVASRFDGLLLRIEFDTGREIEESLMEMLEELVFKESAE